MPNPKHRQKAPTALTDTESGHAPQLSAEDRAARKAAKAQAGQRPGGNKRGQKTAAFGNARKAAGGVKKNNAIGMPSMIKRLQRDVTQPNKHMPPGVASYDPSRPKVCYLHIGTHKTGTSSVQVTLARIGARDNWRYVHAGTPNASLGANVAFKTDPMSDWQMRHEAKDTPAADQIRDHVRNSFAHFFKLPANTYILSAESMSKFTQAEARETVAWIKQFVDRVVVVGYVRPVRGFMESVLQQLIKGRGLNKKFDPALLDGCYPKYRERFEPWEAVLAKEDVVLRLFDRKSLLGGDVVLDIAQLMGITIHAEDIAHANESLTLDALKIYSLFLNNGVSDMPREVRARMQRFIAVALKSAGGERMRFASSLVDSVAVNHLDDIAWAEARVGQGKLYIPNDPASADGITNLEEEAAQPATPAMVAWFNDMLDRVNEPPLPDRPSPDQIYDAVQTIMGRARELYRQLTKDVDPDDESD